MKTRSLFFCSITLLLLLQLRPSVMAQQKDARAQLAPKEILLGELGPGTDPKEVVISPDGKRLAYLRTQANTQVVVVDGVEGKPYAGVRADTLRFSPDSKHLAYVASSAGEILSALNGAVVTDRYHSIIFSMRGSVRVVLDGQEGKEYGGIDRASLVFSPDSRRIAYLATPSSGIEAVKVVSGWRAVIDGKEEALPYDDISPYLDAPTFGFSPDSRHLAYVALRREEDRSSRLGYRFYWFAVVDGQKGKEYDKIVENTLCFSPDSQRIAYAAARGGKQFLVLDGVEAIEYDAIRPGSISFSPDSKRYAYIGGRKDADKKEVIRWMPVIDGIEKTEFGSAGITFSPDSKRVAYISWHNLKEPLQASLKVDDVEGKEYYSYDSPACFSPDSRSVAYMAQPGKNKSRVVVDGQEGKEYSKLLLPVAYSPDGKHIAYRAWSGKNRAVLVVDGVEGPSYEDFPASGPLAFDSNQSLYTIARRGNKIYRIEVPVGP